MSQDAGPAAATEEYPHSEAEARVYQLLYDYINKPTKPVFPEMEPYDLALRLLGLQGSSTAAIPQTIKGVTRRLGSMDNAQNEIEELNDILDACTRVTVNAKVQELLQVLEHRFRLMKKSGARGFNLEESAFVIQYDLLYTTLKSDRQSISFLPGSAIIDRDY